MNNTLVKDDRVSVSKLTPGVFALERGDIVVFADPGLAELEDTVTPEQGPVASKIGSALYVDRAAQRRGDDTSSSGSSACPATA